MSTTDSLLARHQAEIEQRHAFIDGLIEDAEKNNRDLATHELERIGKERDRIQELHAQIGPIQEVVRLGVESRQRHQEIVRQYEVARNGDVNTLVEYRSAGEYVLDRWKAGLGGEDAVQKIDLYHRAAAHQTTTDNPGLLPQQILGPVVNYIDAVRPLVSALGPRQIPGGGSWSRPRVTQHTTVGAQSAEKAELPSQKMTISKIPVTPVTYGGYVNVSRQDIDWTQPSVMDIVIQDLAGQYAIKTEDVAADAFAAAATAGTTIPTGTPTPEAVAGAFWAAAGTAYTAVQGQGRLIAAAPPQMLGIFGPLFAPIGPQDAQSQGFYASAFGQGAAGSIAGIPIYVTAGLANNTMLVMSTAAAEVYEDRIGSLQVVEPSVLGVQVAYAGYFVPLVIEAGGIVKITKTP